MTNALIAGESWVSEATHYKGFDSFTTVTFHTGVAPLRQALEAAGVDVTYMPAHEVPASFPGSLADLAPFDVVILSDIGANSLLLHPDTWLSGRPTPNRLRVLADWTRAGGGLMMAGGYLSFQGFEGKAFYRGTPIEEVLPCHIDPFDDRVEEPQGVRPAPTGLAHPIIHGIDGDWPPLLGYNRVRPRDGAAVLATCGPDPLLIVREIEHGRSLAWTSDIGPHWCPNPFVTWDGYARLMVQSVRWLSGAT